MNKVTKYLVDRQVDGRITSLRQIAQRLRCGNDAAVNALLAAHEDGEISFASYPPEMESSTVIWLMDVSQDVLSELNVSLEEVQFPALGLELLRNNSIWAARVYWLGHHQSAVTHQSNWLLQQEDLYRDAHDACVRACGWLANLPEEQRFTPKVPLLTAPPHVPEYTSDEVGGEDEENEEDLQLELFELEPAPGTVLTVQTIENLVRGMLMRGMIEEEDPQSTAFTVAPSDYNSEDEQPDGSVTQNQSQEVESGSEDSTGICAICGKTLTDPTSVTRGIGPICFGRLARFVGVTADRLADPEQTPDEVLGHMVLDLRTRDRSNLQQFDSEEEAAQTLGEDVIPLPEVATRLQREGISTHRMVRAMGGDRGVSEPINPWWRFFKIGTKRYFRRSVLNRFQELLDLPSRRSA